MSRDLSAAEARRIAIAAQGLAEPRPADPGVRQFKRMAARLGAIQIDSVNVLARAHYLPGFTRLGAYPREALDREAWGPKPSLFEYWAHAACLISLDLQPLFRWKMARARAGDSPGWLSRFRRERADYIDQVLAEIARRGPVTGGDFADGPRKAGWWSWSDGKRALEWLFLAGLVTTRTRRGFERVYDLTERVLPASIASAPTPDEADAHGALLLTAARAMGVATEADLRDYFGLPLADARARLAELVEDGRLVRIGVEGWRQPAYLHPDARQPRRVAAATLLSPFDNLIWAPRDRLARLFDAHYRIEIYVPAARRQHGYYVLPFLQGETLSARVDLKSDRATGALRVQAAHLEPGRDPAAVAPALAAELRTMAGWLGLVDVAVADRGDLAAPLKAALG